MDWDTETASVGEPCVVEAPLADGRPTVPAVCSDFPTQPVERLYADLAAAFNADS